MSLNRSISKWVVGPMNISTTIFDKLSHLGFLAIRLWLFKVFFMSGLTKIQSWDTTLFLFKNEYDIPFLPPEFAAISGTAAELILPILLVLGVGARLPAFALFLFNIVAVIAYQSFLFSDDGSAGLMNHILWGFMILAIMAHGHGKLSIDFLLQKICSKYKY